MSAELRRLGPWVFGAAVALAAGALLALGWSALLLRLGGDVPALTFPAWAAAAVCLLAAAAAAAVVPPVLRLSRSLAQPDGRGEGDVERALAREQAVWRTLGVVAPGFCVLAVLVLLAGAGLEIARRSPGAPLLRLAPGVPRYEDLDRACAVAADRFLCLGIVRYNLTGRPVAYGDWVVLRHGEGATIAADSWPSSLRLTAEAAAARWSIELRTPHDWPLRDGLYTGADTGLFSPRFRPSLELSLSGPEPPEMAAVPKLRISHPQNCEHQVARFRIAHLLRGREPGLRGVQADFERACRDEEGAWVTVGRIGYRGPAGGER